ncbi:MAG: hypothetical protein WBP93_15735 [Pyrinomonadaceae bacterium]
MTKKDVKRVKMSMGAYEPRKSSVTQQRWRGAFLEVVRDCESKVLEDLSREPMRFFQQAGWGDSNIQVWTYHEIWITLNFELWHRANDPRFLQFRRVLWDWGARWGLEDEWCLKAAFDTLMNWSRDPDALSELAWSLMIHAGGYVATPIPASEGFSFECHGWDIIFIDRANFEESVRNIFEAELKVYCDRIEEVAPQLGYEATPSLKRKRKPLQFIEWFVRYKIQRWTLSEINRHYYPNSDNRNTIRKGINKAASLIGFPLYDFASG